ncbi:hypothetical protein H310_15340, partial [Aphanomyces invadans]
MSSTRSTAPVATSAYGTRSNTKAPPRLLRQRPPVDEGPPGINPDEPAATLSDFGHRHYVGVDTARLHRTNLFRPGLAAALLRHHRNCRVERLGPGTQHRWPRAGCSNRPRSPWLPSGQSSRGRHRRPSNVVCTTKLPDRCTPSRSPLPCPPLPRLRRLPSCCLVDLNDTTCGVIRLHATFI